MNQPEPQVVVPLIDGTATISMRGVTIHRSRAAAVAAPATTRWERDAIRGWTITSPTPLLPGVIELRIDGHALTPVLCAGRSETCLRFGTRGEQVLGLANQALTAMQADDTDGLRELGQSGIGALFAGTAPADSEADDPAANQTDTTTVKASATVNKSDTSTNSGSALTDQTDTSMTTGSAQLGSATPHATSNATQAIHSDEPALFELDELAIATDQPEGSTRGNQPKSSAHTSSDLADTKASFIAFDVETANQVPGSICQFGWVRYEDGKEVDSGTWLCQPPTSIGPWSNACIRIHGIQPQDVENAPTCTERIEQFADLLRENPVPVIAHNARFDMGMLQAAAELCFRELPPIQFHCTVKLSQRLMPELENHKLPTVSTAVGHPVENHHDALADARACGEIFLSLLGNVAQPDTQAKDFPMLSFGQLCDAAGLHPGRVENGRVRQVRSYTQRDRLRLQHDEDLFRPATES